MFTIYSFDPFHSMCHKFVRCPSTRKYNMKLVFPIMTFMLSSHLPRHPRLYFVQKSMPVPWFFMAFPLQSIPKAGRPGAINGLLSCFTYHNALGLHRYRESSAEDPKSSVS